MDVTTHERAPGPVSDSARSHLRELVSHLRAHRDPLCREWVSRISQARLLGRMSKKEIQTEANSIYDNYVATLESGTIKTLQAYARDLSERIIPRGVDTDEVVGIVLLLRDVLARSLFGKYRADFGLLNRVLDTYEPAANRIATTVAVGFIQERDRIRDAVVALRRVNERLEHEVGRIARALHEEAGPLLVSIHLLLKETAPGVSPQAQKQLTEVRERLNQVEDTLRQLSHELRPPMLDEMGLVPALRFLVDGVSARRGLTVVLDDRLWTRLSPAVETTVYRVIQEGLTNVARHAKASRVVVSLWIEREELRCVVQDNGAGMKESARRSAGTRGLGLVGMRERLVALGGTLSITSELGRGTRLGVTIPVGG